ncbi:MAG: FprA family A-type flavoprotein [Candidatus Omnitrophota bacterium]|nr:FprA family A-type flavoprotein [Candidatus Omnitrophota bacterium]
MTEIRKNIHWVGAIDWDLRNFHGYSTPFGSTYNAYLILDEQPTLVDTVKHYCYDEMVSRIKQIIDPAKIRYIISNHTEMDHSGSIGKLLAICPAAEVVCSLKGHEGLTKHFQNAGAGNWKFKVVGSGDTLMIGSRALEFFLMPMVHWPDSMATYSRSDKVLLPNDAFGQHYASSQRFVDEVGLEFALTEAQKYYANIVLPYGGQVVRALEALGKLPVEVIAPSHGLIWRREQDISQILTRYRSWAHYEAGSQAVIVYDTMWHSTEVLARDLYDALGNEGIPARLCNLQVTHISDIMAQVLASGALLVGSPILNGRILPSMAAFLTYLRGLKPKNRVGFTFGSYGWAPAGFREMEDALKDSGITLVKEGVYVNYVPDQAARAQMADVARELKAALTR